MYLFVNKIGSYVGHVHLWNIRVTDGIFGSHHPALPTLDIEKGWGDVQRFLKVLNEHRRDYTVFFEHNPQVITDDELEACYQWINALVSE